MEREQECLTNFFQQIRVFEAGNKVPPELSAYVQSPIKVQFIWYKEIVKALGETGAYPLTSGEQASRLVVDAIYKLNVSDDTQAFLKFLGLPIFKSQFHHAPRISTASSALYVLQTLPVDAIRVVDGDGFHVYVEVKDPSTLPQYEAKVLVDYRKAKRQGNITRQDFERKKFERHQFGDAQYTIMSFNNKDILARKYSIRLRGIDAPELGQDYDKEATNELVKAIGGKPVTILVYYIDQFMRRVGDVYCNGMLVQETLLKKGAVWHYEIYDSRKMFKELQKNAKDNKIGLWAHPNPTPPWKWKHQKPQS